MREHRFGGEGIESIQQPVAAAAAGCSRPNGAPHGLPQSTRITTRPSWELTDVLVTSVNLGSSGGEKLDPTENVTLNFAKVKWTYTDAAGVVTFGQYDIAGNIGS